jgi:hypothetical protein
MRPSHLSFTVTTPQVVQSVSEEIQSIEESKLDQYVSVGLVYKDAGGNTIGNKVEYINGDDYLLLMSESPAFAPGKPANEYREQDLFYVIDMIRSRV